MIKFYTDGAVLAHNNVWNSANAANCPDAFIAAVAQAVAFKGAHDSVKVEAVFDPETATIKCGLNVLTPDNFEALAQGDVEAFARAIFENGGEELYRAYQEQEETANVSN